MITRQKRIYNPYGGRVECQKSWPKLAQLSNYLKQTLLLTDKKFISLFMFLAKIRLILGSFW